MLLGIHNALFLSWRWVWTLGWGKWSTGGCRIPALTYLRMHSCRSTPSCTETPTHDSSTPLSSDHWCRGGHAPRLSHRPPTPSSFFLSLSPPNFSPFPSISLHCSTTRGESTPLSCTPVVMVGLNFFFLLIPFSPVIFEGIPHFLVFLLNMHRLKLEDTGLKMQFSNPIFPPSPSFQAYVAAAVSTTDFHSHLFFFSRKHALLLLSPDVSSWRELRGPLQ